MMRVAFSLLLKMISMMLLSILDKIILNALLLSSRIFERDSAR